MGLRAFTFDGTSSSDFGMFITEASPYNAPERAVEMIEIPGRNGAYALDKGNFENVEQTYHVVVHGSDDADFQEMMSDVRNWLCSKIGYCRLSDDYNPGEYRMATYKSGLETDSTFWNGTEFDVTFDCKPQRYLAIGEELTEIGAWGNTETAEGEVVTIDASSDTAVKALTADIDPIQDLHGYDAPWVGGAGKNKLDVENRTQSGTISTSTYALESCTVSKSNATYTATITGAWSKIKFGIGGLTDGQTYTLSAKFSNPNATSIGLAYYDGSYKGTVTSADTSTRMQMTFTYSSSVGFVAILVNNRGTSNSEVVTVSEIQLEQGSSFTTYAPYSNICPISGHDEVGVSVVGKNLLPSIMADIKTRNVVGTWSGNTLVKNGVTFDCSVNGDGIVTSIALSGTASNGTDFTFFNTEGTLPSFFQAGKTYIISGSATNAELQIYPKIGSTYLSQLPSTFTWDSSWDGVFIRIRVNSGAQASGTIYPMIRFSSVSDDTFEPYNPNGTTYTTTLPSTTYGGTVDVVSGTLKPAPYYASYNGEALEGEWVSDRDKYVAGTTPTTGAQVVNIGKVGTATQLTGQSVELLLGENNIFADSGNVTVEYGHNPTLLTNPTWFPSKPLLAVEGYGLLKLGKSEIDLDNVPVGDITLLDDGRFKLTQTAANTYSVTFTIDEGALNVGDDITASINALPFRFYIVGDGVGIQPSSYTVADTNSDFVSSLSLGYGGSSADFSGETVINVKFDSGTSSTITNTVSGDLVVKKTYPTPTSNITLTYSVTETVAYDASTHTITLTETATITYSSAYITSAQLRTTSLGASALITAYSTISIIQDEVFIDCDIGEAYTIKDGEPISLNQHIDLGSDLPTLPSGDTEVTYDNTITKVEVKPNWWKV